MTDKLKGIEPGQRVRVMFEGRASDILRRGGGQALIVADGGFKALSFNGREIDHPSFKIEPIEEPITEGSRVQGKMGCINIAREGTVKALDGQWAWVWWEASSLNGAGYATQHIEHLERVK